MGCITQLLEMKGDKEILPVHNGVVIEGGGVYKDLEYIIVFTDYGHRCGYVAVPSEYSYDVDNISCHWGITFEGSDHHAKDLLPVPCSDMWLGFDAAHCEDHPCYDTARKYFGDKDKYPLLEEAHKPLYQFRDITHKTYGFMEEQCKFIIDQLVDYQQECYEHE